MKQITLHKDKDDISDEEIERLIENILQKPINETQRRSATRPAT